MNFSELFQFLFDDSAKPYVVCYFFIFGAVFGSFANVVIYRTLQMIKEEEEKGEPSLSSDQKPLEMTFKSFFKDRAEQHFYLFYSFLKWLWDSALKLPRAFFSLFGKKSASSRRADKEASIPPLFPNLMGHSRCPHCRYKIPFYLNVPVLSWFFLLGRCRNCGEKISFRYPLVECLTGCLFAGLFALMGWKWFLLESLVFVFGLIVVSFIDWERMVLPAFFTLPGLYLGLVGGFFNPERDFSSAFIGWLLGGLILWLSGYFYFQIRKREGMGDGDISLMAWIGSVLGWQSLSFVLITSCFFGILVGGWGIWRNKQSSRAPFPFGPCLALGAVCCIFLQFLAPGAVKILSPF